jgi:hypothetical protein
MEILAIADLSLSFLVVERRIHTSSHMIPPGDGGEPSTIKLIKRLPKRNLDRGLLLMVLPMNKIAGSPG